MANNILNPWAIMRKSERVKKSSHNSRRYTFFLTFAIELQR